MKKMFVCLSAMMFLSITSCEKPDQDTDDDNVFENQSCLLYECTNSVYLECSDTYLPSEHNGMDWWAYCDSVINHPPDTCSCYFAMGLE